MDLGLFTTFKNRSRLPSLGSLSAKLGGFGKLNNSLSDMLKNFLNKSGKNGYDDQVDEFLNNIKNEKTGNNSSLAIVFSLIVLVSLFGNTLVIYINVRNRRMHTVTNAFITNLACSDLLITCLNIPFNLAKYILNDWPFGNVMCHVINFVQPCSVYVSTFTLISIALDRHQVIMYPLKPRISIRLACVIIGLIWVLAGLLALPHGIWNNVTMTNWWYIAPNRLVKRCSKKFPSLEFGRYIMLGTFLAQYCIPLLIMTLIYTRIAMKLWARATLGHVTQDQQIVHLRSKKKTIKMLMVVVAVFALCWIPLHTYFLITYFPPSSQYKHDGKAVFPCYWVAMTSVCINPVIYCWLNESFRAEVMNRFRYVIRKLKPRQVHPGMEQDYEYNPSDRVIRPQMRPIRGVRWHNNRSSITRSTSSVRRNGGYRMTDPAARPCIYGRGRPIPISNERKSDQSRSGSGNEMSPTTGDTNAPNNSQGSGTYRPQHLTNGVRL